MAQFSYAVRTVYHFPVAAHLCVDGIVRTVKLIRRTGTEHPLGTCPQCQTEFQYRKPKPSRVRHIEADPSHF